ncbi:MAG: tetratricopeptide repeat protein [Anaerolineales bacterium]|uniref:tetratricopeptide repeat protein n=1 Tax=Promineifilum sp. TaxID=2664178 RepID=UPI001DD37A5A|nr:tetratricopeptide repeat protein [Anaerolineales bacterium]MCO5179699.1 tetratricopeptide repeat protein [Promineifilum sp.]
MYSDNPQQRRSVALWIGALLLAGAVFVVQARPFYQQAHDNVAYTRLNKALARGSEAQLDEAAEGLAAIAAARPDSPSAWRGMAVVHMTQRRLAEVADAYSHFDDPMAEARAWSERAERAGQWEVAQAWHQVGVLLEPDNGDNWYRLARALAEQGRPEAADNYLKALDAPQRTYFGRSNIMTRLGEIEKRRDPVQWQTVLARFQEAIDQDDFIDESDLIAARMGVAEALDRLGRYREALAAYEWVARYTPGNYWANVHSGRLSWLVEGKADKAESYLQKAIALDDSRKWPYLSLAHVYAQSGNHDEAIRLFKKVLTLDPDDNNARTQLEELLSSDGS